MFLFLDRSWCICGMVFLISLVVISCWEREKSIMISPSSHAKIIRYEEELLNSDTSDLSASYQKLYTSYPVFTDLFFREVLQVPTDLNDRKSEILTLLKDSSFIRVVDEVRNEFDDFKPIKDELDQTLENYLKIFPEVGKMPNLYTFVSSFAYQCFVFSDLDREGVGIGLDMFLGSDFPYHLIAPDNPAFSSYLSRAFNKDHLAKKVAEVLVEDKLPPPVQQDFLSLMVWSGKKIYIMDQILHFKPDTVVMEYTAEQLDWCRNNEAEIWEFFFDQNLFYETDLNVFDRLIAPAPFSPGMPKEAPGRTGSYIGWQVVDQFMSRNPQNTIHDLIRMQDPQELLRLSRFKPAR